MENGHYTIALPTTTSTLSIPLTDAAEINVSQLDASGKVTAMLTSTPAPAPSPPSKSAGSRRYHHLHP